jgi:YD repeat-containing protein
MDRITAKATPEGTLNYTYDAAGHVASIASSNTNGASMSYTYDSLNRLSTVVDNRLSGSNTTAYSYDNASNVSRQRSRALHSAKTRHCTPAPCAR